MTPRILVVDDSLTIRRALEFILKPHGYALEFAADGRDALNRATSFAPDLVLLDYVLPDMRGPDVCAALAVMPVTANTPVILVSAKGASIRQAYQDAQNVVSYITKPFKPEVVTAVVANALARVRAATPAAAPPDGARAKRGHEAEPANAEPQNGFAACDAGPSPPPATVEETFSTLLRQLEDAISANAAAAAPGRHDGAAPSDARSASRLVPGLARASQRMAELAQHLVDGAIAPYRLRRDGSLASVAATLFEAHRSLCEAAIALAAAGAPGARTPDAPRLIVACPAQHPLRDDLVQALQVTPEVSAVVLESDFASLPALVKLVEPELVAIALGDGASLDEAWRRTQATRPPGTRLVCLGAAGGADGADVCLEDGEAVRRWIGELAHGAQDPATAVEIGLEIVTV